MRLSHFFIDRPIFATVLSILITLVGGLAYFALPVAQYPEIAPPTVVISANYPGASAETVAHTVATPIEQEVNGVEDMIYMSSQATGDGRLAITVTFKLGTNLDKAQVQVQNRVAVAEPRLPEDVRRLGVTVRKNSPDIMMVIHLLSPDESRDQLYISNFALLQVRDALARVNGVGEVRVFAAREFAMRIWLDPEKLAARAITAGEVVQALRAQNMQVAAGALNRPPSAGQSAFQLTIETQGRLIEPKEFGNIRVKSTPDGRVTRVRDVARVELGAADYDTLGYLDRTPAVPILIFQLPGANALDTAKAVKATMTGMSRNFPAGLAYDIVYNPTEFIAQSIQAVIVTIFEAVVLVVLVVILFLQTWRASIVPIVAIPISLIGTFAVLSAFGYSLNNLSLFGLVLAIGIVVDDAIVVVENVERRLREGLDSLRAAHETMDEVGGALIAIALVLSAVFVPAAFVPGITGQFFRQFAITIAAATVISCFVSLTLSPALCALLFRGHAKGAHAESAAMGPTGRFFGAFNRGFERISGGYGLMTRRLARMLVGGGVVYVGLLALTGLQLGRAPTGFIPAQDQGYLITVVQLPPGSSLARTDAVVRQAADIILGTEGVAHAVPFAGFDGATFTNAPNGGAIFAPLTPFAERAAKGLSADRIRGELSKRLGAIQDGFIITISPPPVRGIGTGGGFKMMIQDRQNHGPEALEAAMQDIVQEANRSGQFAAVFSLFNTRTPKVIADIDRARAEMLGVPAERVFEALQVYVGSAFVNDFNFLGRTYRVTAQAEARARENFRDIANLKMRNDKGEMVPIGAVTTLRDGTGAYRIPRYNLFPAAEVQGSARPGVSTGAALAAMEAIAAERLPPGFSYEWTELAFQEKLAGGNTIYIFLASVVFIFLLLAAQYESWVLPLAVILIVPMCLLAAVTGLLARGMDVNILAQVGFVVLIGLAAKNAILIVEFAKQAEDDGKDALEAAVQAARTRLRPILMTSLAFILGVVPLVIATGAGAEMRQVLGTAVFFGMAGVTAFGLIFTPIFYIGLRRLFPARTVRPAETKPSSSTRRDAA
ncbi:MAG: efflux RND transporter permease subunit [Alphaproteobacteria bacterium]